MRNSSGVKTVGWSALLAELQCALYSASVNRICLRFQSFYGIIVRMYFFDNQQHNMPHIHVHYQDDSAIIELPSGTIIEGTLPRPKQKLVTAWIEIHKDELMADWQLALNGEPVFKIDPLK